MPSPKPVTAIFDIGKTNKKFLLFDENYSIVYNRQINLEESEDDEGFPCENLQELTRWIRNEFNEAASQQKYTITGLNFSTYGATLVHLDQNNKPVTPLYNYLKPYPKDLAQQFFDTYGGKKLFAMETSSPPMGMLNSGLQLYWLKQHKPGLFQKIKTSLHFPQYLSFLFTGKKFADLTSLGCHTGMWHFQQESYHPWLKNEELLHLLPPVKPLHTTMNNMDGNHSFKTGIGIHDSSAALAPYLLAIEEPFIQLSTGTWSIAMNPFTSNPLTFEAIRRDCLQYLNIYGEPVKASRLLLGGEYSHQVKKMGHHFGKSTENLECEPDPELIQLLADQPDPEKKLALEIAYETGPYPREYAGKWDLDVFNSYKEAAHQCMLDLASIQADVLGLAEGASEAKQVIITGGFAKNHFFCRLLATMFPHKKIYTASTPYASALGAALVLKMKEQEGSTVKKMLGLLLQKPFEDINIAHYSWAEPANQI